MLNSPTNSPSKDDFERVNNWLDLLEKRIYALLDINDPELLAPAEREQAVSRYLMIMHHLLKLRREYPELSDDEDRPARVIALIKGERVD